MAATRRARSRRHLAALVERTAEHRQAPGLFAEPCPGVEREGSVVPELGVDDGPRRAVAPHPTEGVGDQCHASTLALMDRIDGEALEVALPGRCSGDGVAGDGTSFGGAHPEPGRWAGGEGLLQPGPVELPERAKAAASTASTAPLSPLRARRVAPRRNGGISSRS